MIGGRPPGGPGFKAVSFGSIGMGSGESLSSGPAPPVCHGGTLRGSGGRRFKTIGLGSREVDGKRFYSGSAGSRAFAGHDRCLLKPRLDGVPNRARQGQVIKRLVTLARPSDLPRRPSLELGEKSEAAGSVDSDLTRGCPLLGRRNDDGNRSRPLATPRTQRSRILRNLQGAEELNKRVWGYNLADAKLKAWRGTKREDSWSMARAMLLAASINSSRPMKIIFITKKIVGTMLMPFQFSLVLIISGVCLLCLNRDRRAGQYLVIAGAGLLLIFSNCFVGYYCVRGLEDKYPPLNLDRLAKEYASGATQLYSRAQAGDARSGKGQHLFIVALSGGASDDPELPAAKRLSTDSTLRVVEAVRIYRALATSSPIGMNSKEARLNGKPTTANRPEILMSGGPTFTKVPDAVPMRTLAESLGVPANAILLETSSDDTASEAKSVLPFVRNAPFILVTSAYHMPRAMALFRYLGMRPIPAPSNYASRWSSESSVLNALPQIGGLETSSLAWHEWFGILWERLLGQL